MLRETGAPAASYEGPLPTPEEMCATLNQYVCLLYTSRCV